MSSRTLTFDGLMGLFLDKVGKPGGPSAGTVSNMTGALRAFVEDRGRRMDQAVGTTFRISYQEEVRTHLKALARVGRPPSYIANRKSLLKTWYQLFNSYARLDAALRREPSPLAVELRALIQQSGKSQVQVSEESKVPLGSLKRWLTGTTPQRKTEIYFRRLENWAKRPPGSLTGLLPWASMIGPDPESSQGAKLLVAYRKRLREATKPENWYAISAKRASDRLKAEWAALIKYKTDIYGDADPNMPIWRLRGPGSAEDKRKDWTGRQGDRYCPTAGSSYVTTSQYLGWRTLTAEKGGLGLKEQAETLGHFANLAELKQYLAWRQEKADDIRGGAVQRVARFVRMLCNKEYGFLRRRMDIANLVGVSSESEWSAKCDSVDGWLKSYLRRIPKKKLKRSRDPFVPIQAIVDLPRPLEAVEEGLARLITVRPATGGTREATWSRDVILLALPQSNPVRLENLSEITWREDGTGNLRKYPNGGYHLYIPREDFKNEKGAVMDKDYDVSVQDWLWPYLDEYLSAYRQIIAQPGNDRLFVSAAKPKPGEIQRTWVSLDTHFADLTARYVTMGPSFAPHAMRHIVGTSIIKETGSYVKAAQVLHHRVETTIEHYGWLTGDDSARWTAEVSKGPKFGKR